ncbi:MAG: adenylate/guanylate cyclase domain-containing protein [candidate division KSB1 bacterium]|nr:adenylate/guanylate cyclase domain-containing protein [candidate division KSB1 bacterium]
MKGLLRNQWFVSALLAVGATLLVLLFGRIPVLVQLELRTVDARFALRGPLVFPDTLVAIVAVDDEAFATIPGKWPYPRSYFARAIRNLKAAGARLIVLDIEFSEPSTSRPEEDAALVQAVREAGNVVVPAKVVFDTGPQGIVSSYVMKPFEALYAAAARTGIVNYDHDPDGFLRRYLLFLPAQKKVWYSLGVQAVSMLQGVAPHEIDVSGADELRIGNRRVRKHEFQTMLINFRGPAGTFPTYSLADVLDDAEFQLLGDADVDYMELFKRRGAHGQVGLDFGESPFQGKIVLMGASAEELGDNKPTPFFEFAGRRQKMPGVEMHANAIDTMLRGDYLRTLPHYVEMVLLLCLSLGAAAIARLLKPTLGLVVMTLLGGLVSAAGLYLFVSARLIVPLVMPILALAVSYIANTVHLATVERRAKRFYRQTFQHYVARSIVDKMLESGELPKFGGERKVLTVLFSDIRGFTRYVEHHQPEEIVHNLSEYFTRMVNVIFRYAGTLDKFVGDQIMALFGAPYYFADHAERACRTAVDMVKELRALQKQWSDARCEYFQMGVGINTGQMIVGNLGSAQLFDYTVIGDEVNLASRLEGANKFYQTTIIIGESTYRQVGSKAIVRELDVVRVVGKRKPVRIYELRGMDSVPWIEQDLIIDAYTRGLEAYRQRQWYQALKEFRRVLRYFPSDGPSRLYTKRCLDCIQNPPGEDWDFVHDFREK